jgi:hypothetical protein
LIIDADFSAGRASGGRYALTRGAITVPHMGKHGHIWTGFCRFFSIDTSEIHRPWTSRLQLTEFPQLARHGIRHMLC